MKPRAQPIEWLFFDVGSVLMDDMPGMACYRRWVWAELRRVVPDLTWEEFERERADGGVPAVIDWLRPRLDTERHQLVARPFWLEGATQFYFGGSQPTTGIREVVQELRTRFRLGIIANQHPAIHGWMREHDLERLFTVAAYSCDLGLGKPDRRIFCHALGAAGCLPERAVMLGDRLDNDIAPAKALGMWTVHVRIFEHARREPSGPADTPDAVVDAAAGIPAAIESIVRRAARREGGGPSAPAP